MAFFFLLTFESTSSSYIFDIYYLLFFLKATSSCLSVIFYFSPPKKLFAQAFGVFAAVRAKSSSFHLLFCSRDKSKRRQRKNPHPTEHLTIFEP